MKTILLADDEKAIREWVRRILEYDRYSVLFADDGPSALALLQAELPDLLLLDIRMPGMDGLQVLHTVRERYPELPVIMISGHGTIETAVEATRLGAFDFLPKPLDSDKLLITIRNALEQRRLALENRQIREQTEGRDRILGESPRIREVIELIGRVAPTDARVLITGENGSGKELVAKAIHRGSRRADRPLVEVNCAAIPNELIESELFGHEKGAFTGATGQRIGKFELADGGTIFLDEIGDMSLSAQAKVLRTLEEGKLERVGGNRQIAVDVRVVAATNKNLTDQIARGAFREDLFHRLNVIPIHVPPLRDRREDIPLIAIAFADDLCRRYGMARKAFTEGALRALQSREWSGNVRELRNVVERMVIMTRGSAIGEAELMGPQGVGGKASEDLLGHAGTFQEFKEKTEAAYIRRQLEAHHWNISRTAEALDIQRSHLYNKMKKYGLVRDEGGQQG